MQHKAPLCLACISVDVREDARDRELGNLGKRIAQRCASPRGSPICQFPPEIGKLDTARMMGASDHVLWNVKVQSNLTKSALADFDLLDVFATELVRIHQLGSSDYGQPLRLNGDGGNLSLLDVIFAVRLLRTLPQSGDEWDATGRIKWLTTAANIFDLIYKGEGGIEVIPARADRSPRHN